MKLLHYVEIDGDGEYIVFLRDSSDGYGFECVDEYSEETKDWTSDGYKLQSITDMEDPPSTLPTECILRKTKDGTEILVSDGIMLVW